MRSLISLAAALAVAAGPALGAPGVCADCVRANMAKLAGEELRGRGCGTPDENAAARFIADRLAGYGVKGGLPGGAYLQAVQYRTPTYATPPALDVGGLHMTQGREIVALDPPEQVSGPLIVVGRDTPPAAAAGKIALFPEGFDPAVVAALMAAGAQVVVVPVSDNVARVWDQLAQRAPGRVEVVGVDQPGAMRENRSVIFAKVDAFADLKAQAGQTARFAAPRGAPRTETTYNVVGVLHGQAKDADKQTLLLTAHYDHMGVIGGRTYHGANDDASGTAAVLEFARMLGAKKSASRRTVQFALFGCEEQGGHGARYFLAHAPTPLEDYVANIEFEMIGYADPKYPNTLMMTGWERSNLGPTLAAHGAKVGPDNYPEEHFFERSDNIQLARKGVVAQTISAWPVPPTYHQPTDDLAHLDMGFMIAAIQSLAEPVSWLLNTDFRPEWRPGLKP